MGLFHVLQCISDTSENYVSHSSTSKCHLFFLPTNSTNEMSWIYRMTSSWWCFITFSKSYLSYSSLCCRLIELVLVGLRILHSESDIAQWFTDASCRGYLFFAPRVVIVYRANSCMNASNSRRNRLGIYRNIRHHLLKCGCVTVRSYSKLQRLFKSNHQIQVSKIRNVKLFSHWSESQG